MKNDMITGEWIRSHSNKEKELFSLYTLVKVKEIREKLVLWSFRWTVKECKELSSLNPHASYLDKNYSELSRGSVELQVGIMSKYRDSKVCIRCSKSTSDLYKGFFHKSGKDIPSIDHVFLSIFENCSLCIDCIGDYLLDFVSKYKTYSDSKTI
jgi:hypothetical protein